MDAYNYKKAYDKGKYIAKLKKKNFIAPNSIYESIDTNEKGLLQSGNEYHNEYHNELLNDKTINNFADQNVCECGLQPEPNSRQCTLCMEGNHEYQYISTQKKIWKQVRASSSSYTSNKAGLFCFQKPSPVYCNVNWNQMSDRARPSITNLSVPSRGNSTRRSLTRCRPGATSAQGLGVDVKHGSYDRYLLRKKGACPLKTQEYSSDIIPIKGGKVSKVGMAYSSKCNY